MKINGPVVGGARGGILQELSIDLFAYTSSNKFFDDLNPKFLFQLEIYVNTSFKQRGVLFFRLSFQEGPLGKIIDRNLIISYMTFFAFLNDRFFLLF